jgi:ABC-2 type transport system permease protein
MKRALYITLNEIKLYLQDKGDLAFSLLLPIVTFALMYGAFSGETVFNATAYVVDRDNGAMAAQLIDSLESVEGVTVEILPPEDAEAKLDRSDITFVTVIPEGFTASLQAGQPAEVIFRQRGNGGQEGQILGSIVRSIGDGISQQYRIRDDVAAILEGTDISGAQIQAVVAQVLENSAANPAIRVQEETVGEASPDFIVQYLPGIVTMYVLFAMTLGASAIVQERRRGTLERLLTTRLSVGQMFLGKYLSFIGAEFIQTVILMGLAYAVFQMFTPVSFLVSLFIALIFTAAATSLGMIIAAVARSEDVRAGSAWLSPW